MLNQFYRRSNDSTYQKIKIFNKNSLNKSNNANDCANILKKNSSPVFLAKIYSGKIGY